MKFTLYETTTGRVLQGGESYDPYAFMQAGQAILEGVIHSSGWIEEGVHHEQPAAPSTHHEFSWVTKAWEDPRTLQDLKDAKWEEAKRWREAATVAPLLATRFGVFDGDAAGMDNIKSTVLGLREAAVIGAAPATVTWTLNDNSTVDLTPVEFSEIAAMLLARGDAAHQRARVLRDQIEAATSQADLEAVQWAALP